MRISKRLGGTLAGNYMFKVKNRNTRTMCEMRRSGVFIVNFEHISQLFLVFLLLTLSWYMPPGKEKIRDYSNI